MKVHAEQPFFLPFSHSDVRLGHGWYYSGADGGLHRACDCSRSGVEEDTDPTFEVKSSSWGKVVAVNWDGNAQHGRRRARGSWRPARHDPL